MPLITSGPNSLVLEEADPGNKGRDDESYYDEKLVVWPSIFDRMLPHLYISFFTTSISLRVPAPPMDMRMYAGVFSASALTDSQLNPSVFAVFVVQFQPRSTRALVVMPSSRDERCISHRLWSANGAKDSENVVRATNVHIHSCKKDSVRCSSSEAQATTSATSLMT